MVRAQLQAYLLPKLADLLQMRLCDCLLELQGNFDKLVDLTRVHIEGSLLDLGPSGFLGHFLFNSGPHLAWVCWALRRFGDLDGVRCPFNTESARLPLWVLEL